MEPGFWGYLTIARLLLLGGKHRVSKLHYTVGEAMDSFSNQSRGSSSQLSAQDLKNQLKNQLAIEYAQQFLETVGRKCFEKCVTKPGSSLGGSESSCISRCVDRYIEATGIISKALFSSQ
ncbi:Mitochondrial import inner membrane translocase subunit Tim13 [Glycine soja]